MATIAFHNGGGKAHRAHNIRAASVVNKQPHIRADGVYEVWRDETPQRAYKRIFGAALDEYNAHQIEQHRLTRVKTAAQFYEETKNNKKQHAVYEAIVGIYGDEVPQELQHEILKEFVDGWAARNPHLELIGVYYHADEASDKGVHIHCDYIPRADGYTKGMSCRPTLGKALEQQGFTDTSIKLTAQMKWQQSERDELERLVKARGFHVEHPDQAAKQQEAAEIEHLETAAYKAKQEAERQEQRRDRAVRKHKKTPLGKLRDYDRVATAAEETAALKQREAALKEQGKQLRERERQLREREEQVNASQHKTFEKADELLYRERQLDRREAAIKQRETELGLRKDDRGRDDRSR